MSVPVLIPHVSYRSNIIMVLFPFRYLVKSDIFSFGGMLTNIWIWSGIACALLFLLLFDYIAHGVFYLSPHAMPP